MNTECSSSAFGQDLEIAARLSGFNDSEGVLLAGDRKIGSIITGDLEEYAAVGSALVGLAGRVQEARAKAKTGGDLLCIAHGVTHALQLLLVLVVHLDIAEQSEVVACAQAAEVRLQIRGDGG